MADDQQVRHTWEMSWFIKYFCYTRKLLKHFFVNQKLISFKEEVKEEGTET